MQCHSEQPPSEKEINTFSMERKLSSGPLMSVDVCGWEMNQKGEEEEGKEEE